MKAMTAPINILFQKRTDSSLFIKYFRRPNNIPNMNRAAVWNKRPFSTCQILLYNCPSMILDCNTSKKLPLAVAASARIA